MNSPKTQIQTQEETKNKVLVIILYFPDSNDTRGTPINLNRSVVHRHRAKQKSKGEII